MLLIVGKNSFLGKEFIQFLLTQKFGNIHYVSSKEALAIRNFRPYSRIINFAYNPLYKTQKYNQSLDFDLILAKRICYYNIHYYFLSSRLVYSPTNSLNIDESSKVGGNLTIYGQNKLTTEIELSSLLGSKLTILRLANILGFELHAKRKSFMFSILQSLRDTNQVFLNINPLTTKDFLPIEAFCEILFKIMKAKLNNNIINIGSGLPLEVSLICQWVIHGYSKGYISLIEQKQNDIFENFYLNISKLKKLINYSIDQEHIRECVINYGRRLKND